MAGLSSELAQVMIEMLVHQYSPLLRCEATEKAVRMSGAGWRAAGGKAVN